LTLEEARCAAANDNTFIYKKITESRIYLTDGMTIININNFRQFIKASIKKTTKESIVLFYMNKTKSIFRILDIPIKASTKRVNKITLQLKKFSKLIKVCI